MISDDQITYCAGSPNAGERLTVNYLRRFLPDGVLLVNYFMLARSSALEIDVVVINGNGVYLLEVKHWYGPIKADSVGWRHSCGELRNSPIPSIESKAKRMKGMLRHKGWKNISVVGLVVLSKGRGALDIDDLSGRRVFGLHESLINALTGRGNVYRPTCRRLNEKEAKDLKDTIVKTHLTDADQLVCGYRVQGTRVCDIYTEYIGQDLEFPLRQVRIKQYDVPEFKSPQDLEVSVRRFKREMDALVKAGPHLNVIAPHRFHRHESSDERYYLILEWTGGETLADRISDGPIERGKQLEILNDIAAAVAHCHAQGVYHRNLSPASVYLIPTGRAKVGDFDFAKVPAISHTLSLTTKRLLVGRHVAPEQAAFVPDVDQCADIFALGATWYDMLLRPGPDEVLDRTRIAEAPLSEDAKDFLQMLVAERRSERPQSMQEVQEWLAVL